MLMGVAAGVAGVFVLTNCRPFAVYWNPDLLVIQCRIEVEHDADMTITAVSALSDPKGWVVWKSSVWLVLPFK